MSTCRKPLTARTAAITAAIFRQRRSRHDRLRDAAPLQARGFFAETAALLRTRLQQQLGRLAAPTAPRSWPDALDRFRRPALAMLPPPQRRIARRKVCPLIRCGPDEAALTMDLMGYAFMLFADVESGQDSLVHHTGPTGYRLTRLTGLVPPGPPVAMPWTIGVDAVPRLSVEEAVDRLNATDLPYRFFEDATTGRGSVLYLRYDGHYGLLTAAGSTP
ncbi:sigma 54 modulation/S30EA ribosomal C-terminal domain-containing protein [Amycolatopsis sp. NPDC004625]|uniref:sigma 54 modulation/S30EA ribosomal C-terminal domain-containing protein n=1 Tax=Amycolatopsis sp. NPDC004625 TaxID=3154670 RepID=UPI0033A5AE0B